MADPASSGTPNCSPRAALLSRASGRTGLCNRGTLGKWGPNHAADPIVTRRNIDKKGQPLEVVVIKRKDTGAAWNGGSPGWGFRAAARSLTLTAAYVVVTWHGGGEGLLETAAEAQPRPRSHADPTSQNPSDPNAHLPFSCGAPSISRPRHQHALPPAGGLFLET